MQNWKMFVVSAKKKKKIKKDEKGNSRFFTYIVTIFNLIIAINYNYNNMI